MIDEQDIADIHAANSHESRERRYPYLMTGKITRIEDPASSSQFVRVKAQLTGMADGDESYWLLPIVGGAIESTPNAGDFICVWFEDGMPERGFYGVWPGTNSRNRPTEHMVLGDTAWGMLNYLVDQYNQLRTDFNSFVTTVYNLHKHDYAMGTTLVTTTVGTSTSATAANKGKGADGTTIANKSTSEQVVSKNAKVR